MESKETYGRVSRSIKIFIPELRVSRSHWQKRGDVCKHVVTYRACSKWNEVEAAAASLALRGVGPKNGASIRPASDFILNMRY